MQTQPVRATELPQTSRTDADGVMTPQYEAMLAQLRQLDDADWDRPSDCTGWTVRDIAAHVTGAMDEGANVRVMLRHMRTAKRSGRSSMVDGLNEAQIADRGSWSGTRIIDDLARLAPKAVRRRRKAPGLLRKRTVPGNDLPTGSTFGYLFDVIYARDVWMHRIDIARATGGPLVPTESDPLVVAQVVRDLGRYWEGPPLVLELTGEAGSSWLLAAGAPVATVRVDAVEYCRQLSGRTAAPEFAIDGNEAVHDALAAARVTF